MVEEDRTPRPPLAEGDRGNIDRLEAFVRGAPRIPPRFTLWLLGAFVVLGLGGVALDQGLTAVGLNPTAPVVTSGSPTSLTAAGPDPTASGQSPTVVSAPIPASESALMGLSSLSGRAAPPIALSTTNDGHVGLQQYRGMVVVISFFDATCDDICHVLAAEMAQADADLGSGAQHVAFLTVNTDPLSTDRWPPPSQVFAGLKPAANWTFATGTRRTESGMGGVRSHGGRHQVVWLGEPQ
jgi:cytochrome oxidase Cu insertion factor (SCO1/SenC/PrrC family)